MKNFSLPQILGAFFGFLLLVGIGAFVAVKMSSSSQPQAVVTKKYDRTAEEERRRKAEDDQAAFDAAMKASETSPPPPAATQAQVDAMGSRMQATEGVVANHEDRLAALEARLAQQDAAAQRARKAAPKPRRREVKEEMIVETMPVMKDYKSLAVVNGRAWIAAPGGAEQSVTVGDNVPAARIKGMSKESGVVITTNDELITPR